MAKIEIIKKELVSIENFFESKKDEISSSMYSKELNKIFKDLTRIRKEIDSETYFISIIGGIKTGKSTLINLLCHKNVSTTRAGVETTKRPVIVSSGEEDKIIIFKKEELSSLDIDDNDRNLVIDYVKGLDTSLPDSIKIINKDLVEEEVSNLLTNNNEPDSDKIILINITVDKNHLNNYDNCLLRNKIMFIDTPGLDGLESSVGGIGNNNGHWLLNRVDLSIILQSTVSPINNSLDIYLKKLHEQQTNINYMLVHNKFSLKNWLKDISPFENEINKNSIKKALETLSKIAKKKYIWKEVDLAKAEDAYEKSDIDLKTSKKELLLESNFEIFEEEISNLIKKDKQQSHINKCFYDLKNFIHNNEFKSIILDDLQEKENQYKKKYKILKDSFDWEKAKKQIEKDLNSPWDQSKQKFDDGFNFDKQIDLSDEINSKKSLIDKFRQEIKNSFLLPTNQTNLLTYLFKREIFNNETVEFLIEEFEIEYEIIKRKSILEKVNFFNSSKENPKCSFQKYLRDEIDIFFSKKELELNSKIDLEIYEAKTKFLTDDINQAKNILKTKRMNFLSQVKNELMVKLGGIFSYFYEYLDKNENAFLEKFIGEKSELNSTREFLNEIETYLNKLKQQVELS